MKCAFRSVKQNANVVCLFLLSFLPLSHSTTIFTLTSQQNATTTMKSLLILDGKLISFFCTFKGYMFSLSYCYIILPYLYLIAILSYLIATTFLFFESNLKLSILSIFADGCSSKTYVSPFSHGVWHRGGAQKGLVAKINSSLHEQG